MSFDLGLVLFVRECEPTDVTSVGTLLCYLWFLADKMRILSQGWGAPNAQASYNLVLNWSNPVFCTVLPVFRTKLLLFFIVICYSAVIMKGSIGYPPFGWRLLLPISMRIKRYL